MAAKVSARVLLNFFRAEAGQDLIEYALLVGLIAVTAVASLTEVGTTIVTVFWDVIAASIPRV
jgi:Flp pilus assembly pilin Flp